MDILAAVSTILLILLFHRLFFTLFKSPEEVPSVPFWEYLPHGTVFPAFQDSRAFGRVLNKAATKYGDIFRIYLGFKPMIVTCSPSDVNQIITATNDFPRETGLESLFKDVFPGGLFAMEEKVHTIARRTLRENFNQKLLHSFHVEMTAAIGELCESFTQATNEPKQTGSPTVVDVSELLYVTTFRVITNVALGSGMEREERLRFNALTNEFVEELMKEFMHHPIRQWLTPFGLRRRFFETRREVREICREFIKKRLSESKELKENRNPDALDTILSLCKQDVDAVSSLVIEFALAGAITTAQELAWSIFEICRNESVSDTMTTELDALLSDRPLSDPITLEDMQRLPYIRKVWKETLRLHSVNVGFSRVAAKEITLKGSGLRLKKGTYVYAFASRCQTHSSIWADPLKFIPERWGEGTEQKEGDKVPLGSYVPFSLGRRSCVGRFLADYEGPLILAELYRRFNFTLACSEDEIIPCTSLVETPRSSSKKDGCLDIGVPIQVHQRNVVAI